MWSCIYNITYREPTHSHICCDHNVKHFVSRVWELQHKGQETNTATYNDGTLLNNVLFDFMLVSILVILYILVHVIV